MYFYKLIFVNLFYRDYQILFPFFIPLITFQKEVFIAFGPFYFLCREAFFELPKGHRSGRSRHFLSFPKGVWSDFLPKKG